MRRFGCSMRVHSLLHLAFLQERIRCAKRKDPFAWRKVFSLPNLTPGYLVLCHCTSMLSRFEALPQDVQLVIMRTAWRLCFNDVMNDLTERFHCNEVPTPEFLKSLKVYDTIRYLSDFGWETSTFRGLSTEYYTKERHYYYVSDTRSSTLRVWKVHPLRPISRVVLHSPIHPCPLRPSPLQGSIRTRFTAFFANIPF